MPDDSNTLENIRKINEEIEKRFNYFKEINDTQKMKCLTISNLALNFALNINKSCPDSREKAIALRKLEEVVFWANSAIERN